jgi:hypothetical protein
MGIATLKSDRLTDAGNNMLSIWLYLIYTSIMLP